MIYYSDRLTWAMEKAGVSVRELATVLSTSYQAVKKVLDGRSTAFNSANNAKAALFLNISSDWLALGIGPVERASLNSAYLPSHSPEEYTRIEPLYPSLNTHNHLPVNSAAYIHHLDIKKHVLTEQFGTASTTHLKTWSAIGSSMAPVIQDQDLVLIDTKQNWINAPGYYLIETANLLLLKKVLIQSNQSVILKSENSTEFPDEEHYAIDKIASKVTIRGKVISWWTRKKG